MRIVGRYSFNGGAESVQAHYAPLLAEVEQIINTLDSEIHKTKVSEEVTMPGKLLYSPKSLNAGFSVLFEQQGWVNRRVICDYPTNFYTEGYSPPDMKRSYREMDFVKDQLGVEIQFGKYAFMVYNVAAKMTIFRNLGIIQSGIEIVPVKEFADEMSSGVSYFEQFVWDLEQRGTSNIDVPVLVLGIMR